MTADIAIHDAYVLTVDDRNRLYERGTVLIEDGRITDVRSSRNDDANIAAARVIDGEGTLVMPGLVNAHTHLELTPLIGAFSDLDLMEMMSGMTAIFGHIAEGEYDYLTKAGYELAALNFLAGGVTTVNSMDVRPSAGAETFGEAGLRGFFGMALSDLFWDVPADEQFARARRFIDEYHDTYDGRIRATINPHDDWSCTRELWERTADLAAEYPDLLVHTHLLELEESNKMARSNGAEDSLNLLDDVGLLDDRLVAAHFRLADDEDIRRTADADASVAHCPSIFCYWNTDGDVQWTPVPELREAGIDVGLGIDDHYWHDSYSMFGEARQARLAANLKRSAGQYDSMELVRMLTTEGAEALGVGDEIGSLEPGKRADVILLDVDKPKFTPLTNIPAQIANNAAPADVETVIVDGDVLMQDGEVKTMDAEAVCNRVKTAVDRFESETDWELGIGGSEPPGATDVARDLPKRGPAQLLGRLAFQSVRDRFPF
ncbi:5-methylthioadenosine/S-adenosylhomocysteine deaminase [Natronoarchaeum philippinense]|uniref:5-methylthioadenosine/S-adenosylhomocysteine deaminase n=1 Tax=Natronoarchaeum philippinense TaxID=558529 RepID=A0A285N2L7_NATPI|nr:amidohydrolase family protein [Natronoarchaeum philippinense]SNZ03714.1 5-methylthioadenosine/S-adenosylhomocysteine deaminase [Natronoarchaeum philippinense]